MKNYTEALKKLKKKARSLRENFPLEDLKDLALSLGKLSLDKLHRSLKK